MNKPTQPPEFSKPHPWHHLDVHFITKLLKTDLQTGLYTQQANERRAVVGLNKLDQTKKWNGLRIFSRQFNDALIFVLATAALIAIFMGEWIDAWAIFSILLLNGILGFIQEYRADRALAALRSLLAPTATVIRDGQPQQIPAIELVPGDIVELHEGNQVPADIRLCTTHELRSDESTLTGESLTVQKSEKDSAIDIPLAERHSMAWMGTTITKGHAQGVVVNTGMTTEFGKVAALTQQTNDEHTPLQKEMSALGKGLGILAICVGASVAVLGLWRGQPLFTLWMTAISTAVAIVPEGLPAVVTVTLALGVRSLAQRKALVRRLQAAETLGATSVICTDKTGTLTQNQMTVQHVELADLQLRITGVGYAPEGNFSEPRNLSLSAEEILCRLDLHNLLQVAITCNHSRLIQDDENWHIIGDPTEGALLTLAEKSKTNLTPEPIITEFAFTSERKLMTTITLEPDSTFRVSCKGAPDLLLARCNRFIKQNQIAMLSDDQRRVLLGAVERAAQKGLRTLGFAQNFVQQAPVHSDDAEQQLIWLGFVGMTDPPRPDVAASLDRCKSAGIKVIMITGDATATATSIAEQVGLPNSFAITGTQLADMPDTELQEYLKQQPLFARVSPAHKLRIVGNLQASHHVVAMTGDGVNDAPALKKADIGIAMGMRGNDVAKQASDIVLMDDRFTSIVGAIHEGRRQYANIQKFVAYLLASNSGELVAIIMNQLLGGPLILVPVQILWINLVTDGATALTLGLEPAAMNVMEHRPRKLAQGVIHGAMLRWVAITGAYLGLATFAIYSWSLFQYPNSQNHAQTMALVTLILGEKFHIFNFMAKTNKRGLARIKESPWLFGAVASMLALTVTVVYVPTFQIFLKTAPLQPVDWLYSVIITAPILTLRKWISVIPSTG